MIAAKDWKGIEENVKATLALIKEIKAAKK